MTICPYIKEIRATKPSPPVIPEGLAFERISTVPIYNNYILVYCFLYVY